MHLHVAQPWAGCSRQHTLSPNCNVVPSVLRIPHQALHTQPARDVVVRTTKATVRSWDDLAAAVPRPNPEKRFLQDINFNDYVKRCGDWESLQRMEEDLRDRYDKQPYLALAVLSRATEVVDVETAGEDVRRQVAATLNSSIAPFIINKGIFRYKPQVVPSLLASLALLRYRNPRLNTAVMRLFESGLDSSMARDLCSVAASAALLGIRQGEEAAERLGVRVAYVLRHCTAQDVGNLATALASYSKLPPSLGPSFLTRFSAHCRPLLADLSGEQLVDLLALFVRHDVPLTSTWVVSYQSALTAALPSLTRPRAFATLLFSLAKGSLAITEDFLAALLERLTRPAPAPPPAAAAPPTAAAGGSPAAAAAPSRTPLGRMRGGDLAVVAAVLSVYGYTPPQEWQAQYVEALEERLGELDAKQVVTVIDTCTELDFPLGGDLMDELLAAAEGPLAAGQLPAARVLQLVGALGSVRHRPDGPWLRQLQAGLMAMAPGSSEAELAELVAVLPHLPYAYPPKGENTAAVLAAVKARATELKGLGEPTRGSIKQALQRLGYTQAADFANSLKPPPPPPTPPPPPPPAAPAAPPAPPAKAPRKKTAVQPPEAVSSASVPPSAPISSSSQTKTAATGSLAVAASTAAAAVPSRQRQVPSAPPPPPPPPPAAATTMVASTRGRGRAMYDRRDEEEEDWDEMEEEEEEDRRPALRRASLPGREASGSSATAAAAAAAAASRPAASGSPPAMVGSSRGRRSPMYDNNDDQDGDRWGEPEEDEVEDYNGRAAPAAYRRAAMPGSAAAASAPPSSSQRFPQQRPPSSPAPAVEEPVGSWDRPMGRFEEQQQQEDDMGFVASTRSSRRRR